MGVPLRERLGRRVSDLNQRPFSRFEAAFYEFVAAPAVRAIISPVLVEELRAAPAGAVLDVGCGGGAMTRDVQACGRAIVGSDPSIPQLERLRRHTSNLECAGASAVSLPFSAESFAAVVSSCSIKHWPDRMAGLVECARVLGPDGRLVVVEIDGGQDPGDLLRFAARTRIPAALRRLYPPFARRSFVTVSPTADAISADCAAVGFADVRHWRLDGLPFFVVTAYRSPQLTA